MYPGVCLFGISEVYLLGSASFPLFAPVFDFGVSLWGFSVLTLRQWGSIHPLLVPFSSPLCLPRSWTGPSGFVAVFSSAGLGCFCPLPSLGMARRSMGGGWGGCRLLWG